MKDLLEAYEKSSQKNQKDSISKYLYFIRK